MHYENKYEDTTAQGVTHGAINVVFKHKARTFKNSLPSIDIGRLMLTPHKTNPHAQLSSFRKVPSGDIRLHYYNNKTTPTMNSYYHKIYVH